MKNKGTILFFVFLMLLSIAIPAFSVVKEKANNYFAELKVETRRRKETICD